MKTLVIIDTTKRTRKIVPEHAQEIGRGKFLECEDKRVSRTHGRITKESKGSKLLLRLESLHINSIFCRKKDGTTDYLLKKDETILLEVGDQFRLIQDGDWFEVGEDMSDIDSQNTAMSVETESQSAALQEDMPSKRKHDSDNADDTSKRQRVVGEDSGDVPSTSSQSLSANQSADFEKTMSQDNNSNDAEPAPTVAIKPDPDALLSSCNVPQVQIKPDPDAGECNTGPGDINDPGPSGGSIVGNVPPLAVKPDPDGIGAKGGTGVMGSGVAVMRPSCDFGIRCYRAGQDHRSAFAHPGDLDYRRPNLPPPPPGTPMCPFGARCYRRNPQHFREYDHPDPNAVLPRTPRHYGASRRQADHNMSDEEYPYESEPDFDDTSSDEYVPGMGEDSDDIASDGDDDHDSGLDC